MRFHKSLWKTEHLINSGGVSNSWNIFYLFFLFFISIFFYELNKSNDERKIDCDCCFYFTEHLINQFFVHSPATVKSMRKKPILTRCNHHATPSNQTQYHHVFFIFSFFLIKQTEIVNKELAWIYGWMSFVSKMLVNLMFIRKCPYYFFGHC